MVSFKKFVALFLFVSLSLSSNAYAINRVIDGGDGGGGGGGDGTGNNATPTPTPSSKPTLPPATPTAEPTIEPTIAPTVAPTFVPTAQPTPTIEIVPTVEPTPESVIDLCPDDPNKTAAGQCGCGVPDTDTNTNQIVDCDITREFADIVSNLHIKISALEKAPYAKTKKALQKALRADLRRLNRAMIAFAKQSQSEILTTQSVNLAKKVKKVAKRSSRAVASKGSGFANHKHLALRSLGGVLKLVQGGQLLLLTKVGQIIK